MSRMADIRAGLTDKRERLRERASGNGLSLAVFEFLVFGIKQAWACLFGGAMLGLILATFLFYPVDAPLSRYDFLVVGALCLQAALLLSGLETWEEARVILAFHMIGTAMEIFKTQVGSWAYPEPSLLRIGDVPLFSGFMYAAVGSYLARIWRIFDFRFTRFPPLWVQACLAIAVYVNFFAHHYTVDIRNGLFVAILLIYGRCTVWFRPDRTERRMPLALGFGLVALFIWFAENIGTFAKVWVYPGQDAGWHMVSLQKIGAWYLLMIISFVLVAFIHTKQGQRA